MPGSFVYLQRARGHRAVQIPEILERGGKYADENRGRTEQTGCSREVNPPLSRERNTFTYVLLHLIGMYTSYLAACKPQITQRESEMKDKRIKTWTKKAPEIGIIKREK